MTKEGWDYRTSKRRAREAIEEGFGPSAGAVAQALRYVAHTIEINSVLYKVTPDAETLPLAISEVKRRCAELMAEEERLGHPLPPKDEANRD